MNGEKLCRIIYGLIMDSKTEKTTIISNKRKFRHPVYYPPFILYCGADLAVLFLVVNVCFVAGYEGFLHPLPVCGVGVRTPSRSLWLRPQSGYVKGHAYIPSTTNVGKSRANINCPSLDIYEGNGEKLNSKFLRLISSWISD